MVGDFESGKAQDLVQKYYGSLPRSAELVSSKAAMDKPETYAFKGRYKRSIDLYGASPTPIFMLAYKGEPLGTRRAFVMDILSSILGDGDSSYLTQKYVKNAKPVLKFGFQCVNFLLVMYIHQTPVDPQAHVLVGYIVDRNPYRDR